MKPIFVTTSWDDGHVLDVRLAGLLKKYGIHGTFYVAPVDHESPSEDRLTDAQIKALSASFEIGAHTMTHARLTKLSRAEAADEIVRSKRHLEAVTGKPVTSFCYPCGEYRKEHIIMVRDAGFLYARTVTINSTRLNDPRFEARTTVNTYNHFSNLWAIARFARLNPVKIIRYFHWDEYAKAKFDFVMAHGGQFHLWGHSWEIDAHGDWEKLEGVLAYISGRPNAHYVTNGEYIEKRPKKVLIATPYFLPYHGGVQIYSYNIAKRLQRDLGWEVRVVTSGEKGGPIVKDELDGLVIYRLPYWMKISNTPISPFWPFMVKRIIRDEEFTVLNAHAPVPFLADVVARAAGDIPFILTYHTGTMKKTSFLPNLLIGIYEGAPLRSLLRRADAIVCPSDFVRLGFLNAYAGKSTTITPGVDTGIFKPGERGNGPRTVLFVGGLTKAEQHKGLHTLIEAFAIIHKTLPDVHLAVAGWGNMIPEYRAMARKFGIGDVVDFKGRLSRPELVKAYQESDIFVLCSTSPAESFGMVLIEAMATGKPVVGSNAGGIPLVVDDGENGFLVKAGDSAEVAAAVQKLLDDPALAARFGSAGLKKAAVRYDWNSKGAAYDSLFTTF